MWPLAAAIDVAKLDIEWGQQIQEQVRGLWI